MKKILGVLIISLISIQYTAQNFDQYKDIPKEKLLNDLELLYQGLDQFHSGMYWYTTKNQLDSAFSNVKSKITSDLNVLEFHKLIKPLISLSREGHTAVRLPSSANEIMKSEIKFMPLTVVFLGEQLYCTKNGSNVNDIEVEGKQIVSINGETTAKIFSNLEHLLISDGYNKSGKYNDLKGFSFSKYYYYFYGQIEKFEIAFKDENETVLLNALNLPTISVNLQSRYSSSKKKVSSDLLEYKILNDSTAYLGIHSFSNSDIKEQSKEKNIKSFLENSFASIHENNIQKLIIDVSKNSGGTEGNEGLLYSYLGDNYQKYQNVKAKTYKVKLDNGIDQPIVLKSFGLLEKLFVNKRMNDGSYERRKSIGLGLMAYKEEPEYKFGGKVYVIISPTTYSGGSEFSNMMYTNDLATFVGEETGGGYLGNTSGYSKELVLPNSKVRVFLPTLQFVMNVQPKLPSGSGVIPHHRVIPTFEEYMKKENAALRYILKNLEN